MWASTCRKYDRRIHLQRPIESEKDEKPHEQSAILERCADFNYRNQGHGHILNMIFAQNTQLNVHVTRKAN